MYELINEKQQNNIPLNENDSKLQTLPEPSNSSPQHRRQIKRSRPKNKLSVLTSDSDESLPRNSKNSSSNPTGVSSDNCLMQIKQSAQTPSKRYDYCWRCGLFATRCKRPDQRASGRLAESKRADGSTAGSRMVREMMLHI